ncbi:MAG TPA: dihydroxyacetone kinase subunit DhaL [Methylomirabilota bacterium]|nr:dihydroxyacetone kinase subunit DhaL [Methylomirabilota bacterium]
MVERLNAPQVRQILLSITTRVMQGKDELNSMDSACGDGDFGTSMWISFSEARKQINLDPSNDTGIILLTFGHAILSSAGGAAGPIFGSLFIEAGKVAKGKEELDATDLTKMFEASLNKIKQQGGAKVGDKTVVDALEPAIGALRESAAKNSSVSRCLANAANAAKTGCEATKGIVARHGKAKYLGEQTLGYVDPGAYVMTIIFEEFAKG